MSKFGKNTCGPMLLAILFLGLCFVTNVTPQSLPLTSYTTADGLPHDYVYQIVKDSRGLLWFCTGEGLSRFDGYEFKNYTQADGLPHRSINDLLELPNEIYLVATNDGLALFDPKGVSDTQRNGGSRPMFRIFRPLDVNPDRRASNVTDLHLDRAGRIWAGTMDGFYEILSADGEVKFKRIEHPIWRRSEMLLEFVGIAEDARGKFWLATAVGIFRYDPESGEVVEMQKGSAFKGILADSKGNIWTGTRRSDYTPLLFRHSAPGDSIETADTQTFGKENGLLDMGWFNAALETSDGRILIGQPGGVMEYHPNAGPGEKDFRILLPDSDVVSLAEDRVGNLWIGTSKNGLLKMARRGFEVFNEKDGLSGVPIYSVVAGDGEEIIAAAGPWDTLHFDGQGFRSMRLRDMHARSWGWNQVAVRSKIDGDWWIATVKGVLRYAAPDNFERLAATPPKRIYNGADGLYTEEVFRLYEDSRGDVWIYTFGRSDDPKSYLYLWERATERIRRFSSDDGIPHGSGVTAFTEDRYGNIWLGFYHGGVARYRDGKFRLFSVDGGFPKGFVNALYTDGKGRLWVATGNSGVVRIENSGDEEPRFENLTISNGLSSNQATCITEDNLGRLYFGTGRGITRFEPETDRIKVYTQADGLPYSTTRICARDSNGNLWFAQHGILARLRPESEQVTLPPAVFIGDLRVNGETLRKLSELGESEVAGLELAPEQRQIQIGFFALGFGTGERLLYQYKLEGIDKDWSEQTSQRSVNLNLSPGGYRFLVRAINADGRVSENPAVIAFVIARPIWQRWWFVLLAAIALSGVIYAIYTYRLRRLIELERIRTRIATDLHDDIGSSLSQIAILSEVVRQKSGSNGASEPLDVIADTSREMVDSMSDIVWAINPQKDLLSDLAHRMRRFASDLLDATGIAYRFHLPEQGIDVPLGADVRREVYLIFKECLNNAVKHSGAGEIALSIAVGSGELKIEVSDNGEGFDAQEKLNGNYDGYGGNGLVNMKKRVEKLGGKFSIRSGPGNGTTISFTVPVRKARWFDRTKSS